MAAAMNPTMADDDPSAKQPRFRAPSVAELAARLPRLEILEFIGQGGMGAVYKARQPELDRLVALKILPPGGGGDMAFAERFAREAKALAKLNHPNIVTLYEFGSADGLFFVLMEYVDGVNLRQLMAGGRVAAREALAIVPQICDALQFAHDHGIVHRDIKPENILLDRRGAVKVADFGLAKIIGRGGEDEAATSGGAATASVLTQASKVMGTPQYMSPEQVEAPGAVDHRADIYALGVVFYQMLTGELPGRTIEPPSRKVQIDVRLDEVVLRALEEKPDLRYQQASVFKTQIETIAAIPPSDQSAKVGIDPAAAPDKSPMIFSILGVLVFVALAATNNAVAMMVGSGLILLVGLVWFAKGNRARTMLLALAAAGIATWSVFFISRTMENPVPPGAVMPSAAKLDSVRVEAGKVTITGQVLTGSRLILYAGRRENGFSNGFDHPGQFRATLERGFKGFWWSVQPEFGRPALTLDGFTKVGDTSLDDGSLTLKAGASQEEADGVWSVTIGELVTKSGGKIPIGVALLPPSAADQLPAQLTQEGWQLWQAGKLVEAGAKFREAVQLAPANANAWNGLGWTQFNGGDSAAAEQSFLKAVGIDPNLPGALNGLGQVYLSQRRYPEAEKFLLQAAPQAPAAWFGLTRLYLLQGRFEEAEIWAQKIVDSGQGDDVTRQMLAAAKQKMVRDGLHRLIEPPPGQ
jgi:predicted Ser/Thr protein kinase